MTPLPDTELMVLAEDYRRIAEKLHPLSREEESVPRSISEAQRLRSIADALDELIRLRATMRSKDGVTGDHKVWEDTKTLLNYQP